MILHTANANLRHFPDIHPKHLTAANDQSAVAFGRKTLTLKLLHETFNIHVGDSVWPHPCRCLNNATELIHGKKAFLHVGLRLHIRADAVPVAHDCSHILFRNPLAEKLLFRMLQMLFRKFLIIIVMEIPDRLPVLPVRPEMLCHRTHTRRHVRRMQLQMFLRNHRIIDPFCLINCQFFHVCRSFNVKCTTIMRFSIFMSTSSFYL